MLRPNETVDRFVVEAHVGSGATADVYRVRHGLLGTLHALKVIRCSGAGERFRREGRAQAAVRHRNVVGVTDAFAVGGAPALLLEWVEGPTLAEHIAGRRPDGAEAEALFSGIVEGVAAIHAAGLVHRDLKPANVLVANGVPRVADFGLVKLLASLDDPLQTRAGQIMGTPCYMAPEQASDSAGVGPAADVWALGAIFYEILSGRRLFGASTLDEVLAAVRVGRWTPLRDVAHVHARLLAACLVVDRAHRLPNAGAILQLLGHPALVLQAPEIRSAPLSTWDAAGPASVATLAAVPSGNLPIERTSFVGRVADLAAITARFSDGERLVSIVGPGGAGKTRLALAWAREATFPGGAWFVDLTEARSLDAILAAVAQALDIGLSGSEGTEGAVAQIGRAIAGRRECLVVFDNFEQVVQWAPVTVGRWLAAAPSARFLVTTRERLQVEGEAWIPGGPLPIDTAGRLFDERARVADPGWDPADHRADVRAILDQLDCMPLAIELAAARVRLLRPPDLRRRLVSGPAVLKSSRRDVADRQASVEGAIAWSWDLLLPPERSALAQLSVFRGGFTLDAAEAVVGIAPSPGAPEVWELVQSLVDKSLLRTWETAGQTRFGMYVTIAAFAAARLGDLDPRGESEARFAAFWSGRGPEMVEAAQGADDDRALRRLVAEEENLRAAFEWAVASHVPGAAALFRTIERLLWASCGDGTPSHLGFVSPDSTSRLLDSTSDPTLRQVVRTTRLRWFLYRMTRSELETELAAFQADGGPTPERQALAALYEARQVGLYGPPAEAEALFAAAAPLVERHCGPFETFRLHAWWAVLLGEHGRWADREASYARLLEGALHRGDRWSEVIILTNRGSHRAHAGDAAGAQADYWAALDLARRVGLGRFEDVNVGNLGSIAWDAGRMDQAERLTADALRREIASGHVAIVAACAVELAWMYEFLGRPADADAAVNLATPQAMTRLHEYDRGHSFRVLAFWHYHRGDLPRALAALSEAEAVIHGGSPARSVLTRLRAAIRCESDEATPETGAVPAVNATDAVVVDILNQVIQACSVGTRDTIAAALATVGAHDRDGAPGPIRLAARAVGSALGRQGQRYTRA